MFNKIDVQSPDKECYFCVKLVEGRYTCELQVFS
jgi:kinetochore protein Spc25, animal type